MKIEKNEKKDIVFISFFIILIFQSALQYSKITIISKIFNYIDEVIALILLIGIIYKFFQRSKNIKR